MAEDKRDAYQQKELLLGKGGGFRLDWNLKQPGRDAQEADFNRHSFRAFTAFVGKLLSLTDQAALYSLLCESVQSALAACCTLLLAPQPGLQPWQIVARAGNDDSQTDEFIKNPQVLAWLKISAFPGAVNAAQNFPWKSDQRSLLPFESGLAARMTPMGESSVSPMLLVALRKEPDGDFSVQHGETLAAMAGLASEAITASRPVETLRHEAARLRASEAENRRSAELMSRLMESNIVGVMLARLDGAVTYANGAFLKMVGHTQQELEAGKISCGILTPPEYDELTKQVSWQIAERGGAASYEKEYLRADGSRVPVLVAWAKVHDSPDEVMGFVLDMTELKRAEQEVRMLNMELDQRVRERTAELLNANQELESFAYSVSHDLRAPLRAIDGFSRILLEEQNDRLDPQGRQYLNWIVVSCQRMANLIEDLLNLSRYSQAEMRMEAVNLTAMANAILGELATSDPKRHVEVCVAEGLVAPADRALLHAALENLLNNAWKYTARKAGARIEVGRQGVEDSRQIFYVKDNGAGFDMAHAGKLFAPFQRLHVSREFPGTGIGLATVRRIIHRHGGRIWVDARPDEGATFYFTL
jgi:PAS domain S-box-containing protein